MAQNVSAPGAPIRRAQGKGSDFARSKQFEWLARAGIATRGVIYAIIGVLAIKLAFGSGGETTDQQGALSDDREAAVRQDAPDPHGDRPGRLRDLAARARRGRPRPRGQRRRQGAHRRRGQRDRLRHRSASPP